MNRHRQSYLHAVTAHCDAPCQWNSGGLEEQCEKAAMIMYDGCGVVASDSQLTVGKKCLTAMWFTLALVVVISKVSRELSITTLWLDEPLDEHRFGGGERGASMIALDVAMGYKPKPRQLSENKHLLALQTASVRGNSIYGSKGMSMVYESTIVKVHRKLMFSVKTGHYTGVFPYVLQKKYLLWCYKFFFVTSTSDTSMLTTSQEGLGTGRFIRQGADNSIQVPLYGGPNEGYCAMIAIGLKHMQEFCVLVDTGSSNLAVAAIAHADVTEHFNMSSVDASFHDLGIGVSVVYTGGEWSGELATGIVSILDQNEDILESSKASFALIRSSKEFFINGAEWQGILGLAYSNLAKPDSSVEPYWDSLRRATGMSDVFAMQFCPPLDQPHSSETQQQGGQLVLGSRGNLYAGPMFYTSLVGDDFYRVLITNMTVGGIAVDVPCREFNTDRTIVDSGTTDIYLPTKVFEAVLAAIMEYFQSFPNFDIPDAFWTGDSKLAWTSSNLHYVFANFPIVYIGFASHENEAQEFLLGVTPQIYLRQVEGSTSEQQNPVCQPDCDFFMFGIKRREKGTVIGGNIMLGFTTVFDREKRRVGFAKSTCQYQDGSTETTPHIVGLYPRDVVDCQCICSNVQQTITVLTALAALCVLAAVVLTIFLYKHKNKKPERSVTISPNHSCCWCIHKKPQSPVEEVGSTNGEGTTTQEVSVTRKPSTTKPSALQAAVSWLKHQGSKFIWDLKSKVLRRSKLSLISHRGDAESAGIHAQELNYMSGSCESDVNDCTCDVETDLGGDHCAVQMHDAGHGLEITSGPPSDQNLVSSQEQHDQLVVGKSNYIDDSYPKLAPALSDSPQSSLVAEFACNAARHNNVAEAVACDVQAPNDTVALQCRPAIATHSMSPPESDSESDITGSSNERGKLVRNTPPNTDTNTQNHTKKSQRRSKKKQRKEKERKGCRNATAVMASSLEVLETNISDTSLIKNEDEYQNLLNNHQLQHQEMLNSKCAQSDSNMHL